MPYITQLVLSPRSNQVQSELRDPYQMHRTFAKAFPDEPSAQRDARCLFRVERDDALGVYVLIQTRIRPDWTRITADNGYFASPPRIKQVYPTFMLGGRFLFRVRANPSVAHNGKRFGIYKEEDMLEWIERKAVLAGFNILGVSVVKESQVRAKKAGHLISLSAARFDGILVVTDVDLFTAAWESGIGAAKGFGFGLLSLAPAS